MGKSGKATRMQGLKQAKISKSDSFKAKPTASIGKPKKHKNTSAPPKAAKPVSATKR